ncbi:hypothetical protein [Acinetobacter sp. VT 511]|uniref:hypothetical protein n=1 Tax=Acinetobacter sp. VT 511 TaxID=1675902 RepID=UPI000A83DDB3
MSAPCCSSFPARLPVPVPGVTQTLITFLPVGFTTWQRNLYDTWGACVQIPSREEFESLKSSVSDGKSAIAAAITGKGVVASGSDTFSQMVAKIKQINTGKKFASGSVPALGEGNYRDFQIGFTPSFGIAHAVPYNPTDASFFVYSNINGSMFRIEPITGGVRVKPGTNRGTSKPNILFVLQWRLAQISLTMPTFMVQEHVRRSSPKQYR